MKHLLLIAILLPTVVHSQIIRSWGIDTVGWKNDVFVDSLVGKPIDFYLDHPDIDTYQKKFYKGEFAINNDGHTYSIATEISENIETHPFCFFNLCRMLENTDTIQFEYSLACVMYLTESPCVLLDSWNNKVYQLNKEAFLKHLDTFIIAYNDREKEKGNVFEEKMVSYGLDNINKNCPDKTKEWQEFIKAIIQYHKSQHK